MRGGGPVARPEISGSFPAPSRTPSRPGRIALRRTCPHGPPEISTPTSAMTRIARGCTPFGSVPALSTSTRVPPRWRNQPWAICERARFPVQITSMRNGRPDIRVSGRVRPRRPQAKRAGERESSARVLTSINTVLPSAFRRFACSSAGAISAACVTWMPSAPIARAMPA